MFAKTLTDHTSLKNPGGRTQPSKNSQRNQVQESKSQASHKKPGSVNHISQQSKYLEYQYFAIVD